MRVVLFTPLGTHLVDTGAVHRLESENGEEAGPINSLSARRVGGVIVAAVSLGVLRRQEDAPGQPLDADQPECECETHVAGIAGGVGLALSMSNEVQVVVLVHRNLTGAAICDHSVAGTSREAC